MPSKISSDFFQEKDIKDFEVVTKKPGIDSVIFFIALTLITISSIVIVSASYGAVKVYSLSTFYFASKHILFCFISILIMRVLSRQRKNIQNLGKVIWWGSLIALFLVMLFGNTSKGARRWINIAGFSIQPSEFAKIGVIIEGAKYYGNWSFFPFIYFLPLVMIFFQPDFGTSFILIFLAFFQLISRNFNLKVIGISLLLSISLFAAAYLSFGHVRARIDTFLSPKTDVLGKGYQQNKAFLAMKNGGLFGRGFGKGVIKDLLPDAHTDFIFAVIVEEFGILGGLFVISLFIALGLRIMALREKDTFFGLVQHSLAVYILAQAWLNISSTMGLIPTKGLTLPLLSYGGSAMLGHSICIGLISATSRKKSYME